MYLRAEINWLENKALHNSSTNIHELTNDLRRYVGSPVEVLQKLVEVMTTEAAAAVVAATAEATGGGGSPGQLGEAVVASAWVGAWWVWAVASPPWLLKI